MEDQEDPREPSHFDYKYLKSKAGPLYKTEQKDAEQQPLVNKQGNKQIFERKKYGGIRMCQRCLRTKPDRCHHCSQCNKCILKMDHHCPWVANCIGFYNYKYFISMLLHASLSCLLIVVNTNRLLIVTLSKDDVDYRVAYFIVTAYVLACVFGFIITAFFCFHMWLISKHYTTIEFCEKRKTESAFKDQSPYNTGVYQNLKTILGPNPLLWFLPVRMNLEGNGLFFEIRSDL